MNVYQVSEDVFRFRIWNLLGPVDGHVTVWWSRKSGRYVFGKHGGFGGLNWYPEKRPSPAAPTADMDEFLGPIVKRELRLAYFYDGERMNGRGKFLDEALQKKVDGGEYIGCWGRTVFPADSPLARTEEDRAVDEEALEAMRKVGT